MFTAKKIKNFWLKWNKWIIMVLIVVAAVIFLPFFNILPFGFGGYSKYQAVFLANGQVYFGKIISDSGDYMKLSNIYYLQVNQPVQQTAPVSISKGAEGNPVAQPATALQPDIRLVKLGSELHGPEDIMYIARNQILFYEDLKSDSRVVSAIKIFEKK